jgi:hypothetical protein
MGSGTGQILFPFPAWCALAGGTVLFMINDPFKEQSRWLWPAATAVTPERIPFSVGEWPLHATVINL